MPDVNILVYAHRADDASHDRYRVWLEALVNGPQPFALSVLVAVGFVRIVTNRRIYDASTAAALAVIDAIVARPLCRTIAPGPRHWQIVADLCRATGAAGSRIADAQHAALAIEHGCELVSRDGDFAPFASRGLSWTHLVL